MTQQEQTEVTDYTESDIIIEDNDIYINTIQGDIVKINNNDVYITYQGEEYMQYDINDFEENTGLTVQNIKFPVPAYVVALSSEAQSAAIENVIVAGSNTTLSCGNVIENLLESLKKQIDNQIIIIDFDGIEEVSSSFAQSYTQYLLNTKNKIISINQNYYVHSILSQFALYNVDIQPIPESELFNTNE